MRKVFAAACVLAVLLAVPAAADQWTKYENDRFGYSVEYPDIFSEMKEPENGDGVWLSSKDGRYALTLSGGYNVLGDDGEAMLASRLEDVSSVLSKEATPGGYRLVYDDGKERLFFECAVVNEEAWTSFVLSCPKEEQERFVPVVERMEKSLGFPSGEGTGR